MNQVDWKLAIGDLTLIHREIERCCSFTDSFLAQVEYNRNLRYEARAERQPAARLWKARFLRFLGGG
jgi:hypothetical protein